MNPIGIFTRFRMFLHHFLGGLALHKSLERNQKAARELDAAVREVLQK